MVIILYLIKKIFIIILYGEKEIIVVEANIY